MPVLFDIVKRRFVRILLVLPVICRRETLNLRHMMGCLTAPPDRSREAGLFVPMASCCVALNEAAR